MTGISIGGATAHAWRFATDFMKDLRRSRRLTSEIEGLAPDEAARVLGEIGLGVAEFGNVMSLPFASEDLLSEAMISVGIDPDEFYVRNAGWARDLQRTCARCQVRARCRQIMSRGEFARRNKDFCPNSGDLAQILSAARPGSVAAQR